mmetsp:Transcript_8828/g.19618  ORF Transcript_8828/g.19618 Transcript_8828/m.19618 type:complete len:388 (+) Transcript_8828:151-1314(+)
MKRASIGSKQGGTPKKAKADGSAKLCQEVIKAVKTCPIPKDVAQMLSGMMTCALLPFKAERHCFQERVVAMAGELLSNTEAALVSEIEKVKQSSVEAEASQATKTAEAEAASAEVDAVNEKMKAQKIALADAAKAYKAATASLKKTKEEQAGRDGELFIVTKDQEALVAVQALIQPLLDGSCEDEAKENLIEGTKGALRDLGFDPSMIASLPKVFVKAVADRGPFDKMALDSLGQAMDGKLKELEDKRAALESAKSTDAQAIAASEQCFSAAQEIQLKAAEAYMELEAELAKKTEALETAQQVEQELVSQMKACTREVAKLEKKLLAFREGAMAAYLNLRDREAPPLPPPAEEDEEEPAAMETSEEAAAAPEAEGEATEEPEDMAEA